MGDVKHTPGPWVIFLDQGIAHSIMPAGRPGDICNFVGSDNANANARLIAAAPELLIMGVTLQAAREAHRLNATRENADTVRAASDAFDAAIAKAEGRS